MNCCYFKKKKIIPTHINDNSSIPTNPLSTNDFLKEALMCGTCNEVFSLQQNQLSAMCGGCNKFLHCGIAGKCVGPNCGNSIHRLSWCIECVPKTIIINLQDVGPTKDCLCQECLDDDKTLAIYKVKI
jgi:hypothetical protein